MRLAIFDLDNTLLAGDSDYLWGKFLCQHGAVDADHYECTNQRFYDEYKAGKLDIYEFLEFSLAPLARFSPEQLDKLHHQFMQDIISPLITPAARELVEQHRGQGDTLMIITATNRFITAPIAQAFGVEHLLATEVEMKEGRYTGKVADIPCFQDGKVKRLQRWLDENDADLTDSWFYSDSHNDLPLLEKVTHPVAVNPDDTLRSVAVQRDWPILQLHHDN